MKYKILSILGSTGSIGQNTVDIVSNNLTKFSIYGLTAKNNVNLLLKQSYKLKPKAVAIQNKKKYKILKNELFGKRIKVFAGDDGILEVTDKSVDIVVASIVGLAGLKPTINSISKCSTLCLANKECLVSAGKFFLDKINKYNCKLLPLDSEHNAIFQLCDFKNPSIIDSITLTASGGPFRKHKLSDLKKVNLKQALKHPNWKMGKKITIDSATLMNKAFEIIEAYYLFNLSIDKINAVVHPESVIHSMVTYIDGSTTALLSDHDMKIPISYALNWPTRTNCSNVKKIDLIKLKNLTFEKPNNFLSVSLNIAKYVLKKGGSYPLVMNAANEVAVNYFLNNRIKFLDIINIVKYIIKNSTKSKINTLDDVYKADKNTRYETEEYILKKYGTCK